MPIRFDLSKYSDTPIFVEAGSLIGDTCRLALQSGFKKCYTIEIHPKYHRKTLNNLQQEINDGSVVLIKGDSKAVLKMLVPTIKEDMTIFLDAHWHRNRTDMDTSPLLKELDALIDCPEYIKRIFVDDRRLLGKKSWGKNISEDAVMEKLRLINPNFVFSYELGEQEDDVIVAEVPS